MDMYLGCIQVTVRDTGELIHFNAKQQLKCIKYTLVELDNEIVCTTANSSLLPHITGKFLSNLFSQMFTKSEEVKKIFASS